MKQIKELKSWMIQNSEKVSSSGKELSQANFDTSEWYNATVPSTVLGALVENETIKDPFSGYNLGKIETEPFKNPWWYSTDFELSEIEATNNAIIDFKGINYRADIWLNGEEIANAENIIGAFRQFSFDISDKIRVGKNVLAVKVVPPIPGDFSIGYVDWNPAPPDGNMGIFRPVIVRLHSGVAVENPFVKADVNIDTLTEAALTVSAELVNYTNKAIEGILKGKIEDIEFSKSVTIEANRRELITFNPSQYSELEIEKPRLWWPINMGNPELYNLNLSFVVGETTSDEAHIRFGIREIEDFLLGEIHRGYKVNGKKVLIKGGGWTDDLFLMDNDESLETQIEYVKQMNLNCVRLEGIWGKDHKLYDLCDENGILLMVGWSCHWEHELHLGVPINERFGGVYLPEHIEIISQSWEEQVIWLRNHPSIFVWAVASDKVPITELEQKYVDTFAKYDPTRPYLNSTGGVGSEQHIIGEEDVISDLTGSSGVKMLGPYAYTPPVYWFTDRILGGAYGFNTETGPGAQVPTIESLKKMIPADELWPIGDAWNYHCGRYEFADLSRFNTAIKERYGEPTNLEEFDIKAQTMNYELMRPMFEAFQVNKARATGVVQWMLNAAWPKMYWQLYDHYLMPNGAFYGTQKSCKPLHVIYNYGDKKIYLINDYLKVVENLKVQIRVFDIESNLLFDEIRIMNADVDSSQAVLEIPKLENLTETYFIDLRLCNAENNEMSNNFYWLSTKEDVLDYDANIGSFGFYTPSKEYADFKMLNSQSNVKLDVQHSFTEVNGIQKICVDLKNNSNKIAFMINLKIVNKESGEIILPVFWEDNFVSLIPGESRTISANLNSNENVEFKFCGWNVKL